MKVAIHQKLFFDLTGVVHLVRSRSQATAKAGSAPLADFAGHGMKVRYDEKAEIRSGGVQTVKVSPAVLLSIAKVNIARLRLRPVDASGYFVTPPAQPAAIRMWASKTGFFELIIEIRRVAKCRCMATLKWIGGDLNCVVRTEIRPGRTGLAIPAYLLKVAGGGVGFSLNGAMRKVPALRSRLLRSMPRRT